MEESHREEALARAAIAGLSRLRADQQHVSPDLAVALETLAERAFDRSLQLSELPHACGRTVTWVWRHFESELGCTPKRYLDHLRLETASWLLAEPEPPVYRVCEWVGYKSVAVFIAAFGAWAGETPDAFRQRRLQEKAAPAQDPAVAREPTLTAEEHALEDLASELLASELLGLPLEAQLGLLLEGRYTVDPELLIETTTEESRAACAEDPRLGLELAQLALDTLQDFANHLGATEHGELQAEALACLRHAAHLRQKRPVITPETRP